MAEILIPALFSFILGVISIFSDRLVGYFEKFHEELMSFSAGILITIILIEFLPIISDGAGFFNHFVYAYTALGFVIFYSMEKYVYKHIPSKSLDKDIGKIHLFGFSLEHIIIGMFLIMVWFLKSLTSIYLLMVPFIISIIASSHSIRHLERKVEKNWIGILIGLAIPFGSLIALSILNYPQILYSIFALITGALLYLVVADIIPKYRKGNIYWFVIGFLITAGLQLFIF